MSKRFVQVFYLLFAILGTAGFAILGSALYITAQSPPPPGFEYTEEVFEPRRASYCPGEMMVVDITVETEGAPRVYLAIVANSITDTNNLPIVRRTMAEALVFPTGIISATSPVTTFPFSVQLPDLPPGDYHYIHYAQEWSSAGDYFITPFTIEEC